MADLYEELKQLCPAVEAEDYNKGGAWQIDLLRLDLDLVKKHRKEAGAPEIEIVRKNGHSPPPKVVDHRPAVPKTAVAARPSNATLPSSAKPSALGAIPNSNQSTSDQVRQISEFVKRWELDSSRAKLYLARLKPHQRRWVLEHFTFKGGGDSTSQLQKYIQEADQNQRWGADPGTSGNKRPAPPSVSSSIGGDAKRARPAVPSSKALPSAAKFSATAPRPKVEAKPSAGGVKPSVGRVGGTASTPPRAKSSPPPSAPSTTSSSEGRPGDLIRSLLQL